MFPVPMFLNASQHESENRQYEIPHSFILQVCLHPTTQKIMIYLLLFGSAAVLLGICGLTGFGEGKQQTQTPQISKTAAEYLLGFGVPATLVGTYGFFVSIKYAQKPSVDAEQIPSSTPVIAH